MLVGLVLIVILVGLVPVLVGQILVNNDLLIVVEFHCMHSSTWTVHITLHTHI